jgi:hypothetical protein
MRDEPMWLELMDEDGEFVFVWVEESDETDEDDEEQTLH